MLFQLFLAHAAAAANGVAKALAQRKVARGVFVKQRAVEQNAHAADGRTCRNERALAQVLGPFVRLKNGFQRIVALGGAEICDAAVLEGDREIVNQAAAVVQRHGGMHCAVHPVLIGRGVNLFRGHVAELPAAVRQLVAAAAPHMVFRQAHGDVGADAVLIMQGCEPLFVQPIDARAERFLMLAPGGNGVWPIGAGRFENGLPQRLHRLLLRKLRKHRLCPFGAGRAHNAPRNLARIHALVKGVAIAVGSLAALGALGRVYARHGVRVARGDAKQSAAALGQAVFQQGAPRGRLLKHRHAGVFIL